MSHKWKATRKGKEGRKEGNKAKGRGIINKEETRHKAKHTITIMPNATRWGCKKAAEG